MPDIPRDVLAWTAGILLAVYAVFIVGALKAPVKQHDPQRGQAVGCLMIVLVALGVLGAMLTAGVVWDVGTLVWIPFCVSVFPAISLVGSGLHYLVRSARGG